MMDDKGHGGGGGASICRGKIRRAAQGLFIRINFILWFLCLEGFWLDLKWDQRIHYGSKSCFGVESLTVMMCD
jgi:hypothetical protein